MGHYSWFSYIRDITEVIYFISGIGLLIVGCYALKQIKIAKKSIQINSLRDSALLSAKQCERFAKIYLPEISKIRNDIRMKKLITFKGPVENFDDAKDFFEKELTKAFFSKWGGQANIPFVSEILTLLNDLEAFSLYFTKKIADEEMAFQSLATVYCSFLEDIGFPFIMFSRKSSGKKLYSNILELYVLWKDRITAEQLETKFDKLLDEYSKIVPRKIKPTGTEKF
jgi:hypothetical protein